MPGSARHSETGGGSSHVDLGAAAAIPAQAIELCLVGGVGDGQMLGEGARCARTRAHRSQAPWR